jgi:hypothetical protein
MFIVYRTFFLINIDIKRFFTSYPHLWILGFIYLLTAKGHIEIIDTEYSIRTALSIVENGSLLIQPPDVSAVQNFPKIETSHKIYSPYGIGLTLIFIPFVLLSKILAWLTSIELRLILDFSLSFYNIPFAIMGLYFFQKITLQLSASKMRSILLTYFLGLSTCYWKYTVTDFSEIPQSCLLLGIIYTILRKDKYMWYKLSFLYSFLVLLKLTYFIFFPFLFIFFIYGNSNKEKSYILKNLLKSSSFFLPTCFFIGIINFLRFGNPFESGYGNTIKFSADFFLRDWFGYLFSFERGLLTFSPILLVALLGLFYVPLKDRKPSFIIGITTLIWYTTMCFWVSWQGGYCWGNRLLVPVVPLLLLPLVFLDLKSILNKSLLTLALIGSTIIQVAASFTKIHEIIEIKLSIQKLTEQTPHSQLWLGIKLFFHKIKSPSAEYLASNFGVANTEFINISSYNTFHGFNIWAVHLLNYYGLKTYSHLTGIIILLVTTALCCSVVRILFTYNRA